MILLKLYWVFLQVGLFSVGGGYAAIPLIQSFVVEENGWITAQQFADLVIIAEMTPGPIAVNAATFVGHTIAGIGGTLIATLGCITPSLIIVSLLALLYARYEKLDLLQSVLGCLRACVVALIAAAGLSILGQVVFGGAEMSLISVDWISLMLFLGAFLLLRFTKSNPILVMALCGILNYFAGTVLEA